MNTVQVQLIVKTIQAAVIAMKTLNACVDTELMFFHGRAHSCTKFTIRTQSNNPLTV